MNFPSDIHTSRLAIGTAQFGLRYGSRSTREIVSSLEVQKILHTASAMNISTIDTAISYGNAEEKLGQIGVKDFNIISKLPPYAEANFYQNSWAREYLTSTLTRLGVDRLYGLLLHRPSDLNQRSGKGLYNELLELKNEGLISKIGVSIYHPSELDELIKTYSLDLIQCPVNIFTDKLFSSSWLDQVRDQSIEIHSRSTFLQGVLAMPAGERPAYFNKWRRKFEIFDSWCLTQKITPVQACLAHSLSYPQVSKIVVGVSSEIQLKEFLSVKLNSDLRTPNECSSMNMNLIDPRLWPIF
jgi:aryl-alcohol dehydrogenase-like predicted oxidoreductase